jgi:hypothetical protein
VIDEELTPFEQAKSGARTEYGSLSLSELAGLMKTLQAKKEEVEAELSLINARLDVIRYESIPNKMDEDGVERVSYEGIGRISLTGDMFIQTTNKHGLFTWLEENGFADLIQPGVNASTLKAFVKGRMKKGESVPEECLRITPVTRASITKS